MKLSEARQNLQSVHAGHIDIQHHSFRTKCPRQPQSGLTITRYTDVETTGCDDYIQKMRKECLILED